jgi:hypothetical protein
VQVSSDRFDESDRFQPGYQEVLKDIREAVSDRKRCRSFSEARPANGLNAVSLRGPEIRAEHFVADVVSRHATLQQLRPNVVHEA